VSTKAQRSGLAQTFAQDVELARDAGILRSTFSCQDFSSAAQSIFKLASLLFISLTIRSFVHPFPDVLPNLLSAAALHSCQNSDW